MNELKIKEIEFLGDKLVAAQDKEGTIWIATKWVCKNLGLTEDQTKNERKRINKDLVLKQGRSNLTLPTNSGKQTIICLKLDFLPIWLAKISITPSMKENNPVLVEKLVKYQLKAKDVLAAAFLQQPTVSYQYALPPSAFESAAALGRLIERIMKLQGSAPYEIAFTLRAVFQQAGIDVPECFVKIPAYEQLQIDFRENLGF